MIVFAVAVSAAIFASPASANQPVKVHYPWAQSSDLTGVCSFSVNVDSTLDVTEIDFFNASGAQTRGYLHVVEQDTFSANEKTLVGIPFAFNIEVLFDSNGDVTHNFSNGIVEKIPLPDGSLFVSAGRLDWVAHPGATFILSPDKGNPGNIAGFCAALAP
jgi:hypothetical protein